MSTKLNFTVSAKTQRVYADFTKLTDAEKSMVEMYIRSGYTLSPKKEVKKSKDAYNLATIIHYYAVNKDADGVNKFLDKCDEMIVDKKGTERKGGFLIGRKYFKKMLKDENVENIETVTNLSKAEQKWIDEIKKVREEEKETEK